MTYNAYADHARTVAPHPFMVGAWTVRCSCGWESPSTYDSSTLASGAGDRHLATVKDHAMTTTLRVTVEVTEDIDGDAREFAQLILNQSVRLFTANGFTLDGRISAATIEQE